VRDAKHASVPLRRVRAGEPRWEKFLYTLKAGPAGGRLRRPSSAGTGPDLIEPPQEISSDRWTEEERQVIVEHRWWTVDELRNASEPVFPEELTRLVESVSR
jgi:hypothetical protein